MEKNLEDKWWLTSKIENILDITGEDLEYQEVTWLQSKRKSEAKNLK